jgi:glutamate/tyrosine decarboxylase-like PLP-dependent enzyme
MSLRFLGIGQRRSTVVRSDEQGRLELAGLRQALQDRPEGPTIVCLQAGNVHSGAFDPLAEAIEEAHEHGAWVHVDGAFGLWAAATPRYQALTEGLERADSWATDAHKTLNVPYDNGLAIVADPGALRAAMSERAPYLIQDDRPDPFDTVPEFSRRARGFTVRAALRSLGRTGVAEMVDRLCARARRFADGLAGMDGVAVLNDVVYTQVCVSFGPDDVTREVARRLLAEGTAWMTPSTWRGQAVLRISVSNWRTSEADVDRTLEAVRRVLAEVAAGSSPRP